MLVGYLDGLGADLPMAFLGHLVECWGRCSYVALSRHFAVIDWCIRVLAGILVYSLDVFNG
jgi:hypothetical protein